jgi:hypothetical protein
VRGTAVVVRRGAGALRRVGAGLLRCANAATLTLRSADTNTDTMVNLILFTWFSLHGCGKLLSRVLSNTVGDGVGFHYAARRFGTGDVPIIAE